MTGVTSKMLVESDPYETRIAVLEEDRLTEIHVERRAHRGVVGNVYKGRVTRVLPGMQAAFVDLGLERDAFLYVSDVVEGTGAEDELEGAAAAAALAEEVDEQDANGFPPIDSLLKQGQELLVQVTKDPLPNKGRG